MEKHWKSVVNRNIIDYYFDAIKKSDAKQSGHHVDANHGDANTIPALNTSSKTPIIIKTPSNQFLITIQRKKLTFVGVVNEETPPLIVIEFLHRVYDIFNDYFNDNVNESVIKENYVVVYELLDEMIDNGHPLTTES